MESTVPSILAGLGIALAVGLSASGSATATTAAAPYFVSGGKDQMLILAIAPMVIAGVLSIYGMIVGVIASQALNDSSTNKESLTILDGGRIFAAGLTVGLSCLASGEGLANFLANYWYSGDSNAKVINPNEEMPLIDTGNNNNLKQQHATKRRLLIGVAPNINVRFIITLCMIEAIGLYGLIVALIVINA